MNIESLVQEFADHLADMSAEHPPAERAWNSLAAGQVIKNPSDRVRANFCMLEQWYKLLPDESSELRLKVFGTPIH